MSGRAIRTRMKTRKQRDSGNLVVLSLCEMLRKVKQINQPCIPFCTIILTVSIVVEINVNLPARAFQQLIQEEKK